MQDYQREFIEFSIDCDVLRFGEFTLKSGRTSPYFFNAGLYDTGERMAKLGAFYAQAIVDSGIVFDMLFGPAYKGIPLVTAISVALHHHGIDVPMAFNRKEKKDHGEGGTIVGRALFGKVLIVDDVITAGTAIREAIEIIENNNAQIAGVMVSLDRQEKGQGALSAIQEVQQQYGFPVASIVGLSDLVDYLEQSAPSINVLESVKNYRAQYGV